MDSCIYGMALATMYYVIITVYCVLIKIQLNRLEFEIEEYLDQNK